MDLVEQVAIQHMDILRTLVMLMSRSHKSAPLHAGDIYQAEMRD